MKKDNSRIVIGLTMLACVVFVYSLLGGAFDGKVVWARGSKYIMMNAPWGTSFDFNFVIISGIASLVGCIACYRIKTKKKWIVVVPTLVLLVSPCLCMGALVDIAGGLTDTVSLRTKDGQEYHLFISHFMQGSHLVVARVDARIGYKTRYEVLSTSPWEESWGYLSIVRPEGYSQQPVENGAALYLTNDNVLLGVPYHENCVYLAYDLNKKIAYGQSDYLEGNHHVRELSPFLMLNATDSPNQGDVGALMGNNQFGDPQLDVVKKDLQNANPKVRELAARAIKQASDHPKKSQ